MCAPMSKASIFSIIFGASNTAWALRARPPDREQHTPYDLLTFPYLQALRVLSASHLMIKELDESRLIIHVYQDSHLYVWLI